MVMVKKELVYIDQYNLLGINYYWDKHEAYNITKDDLLMVGLTSDRVQVHKDIINSLVDIDNIFQQRGYRSYIKDGYRPKDLYELIYKKRVDKYGQGITDQLLNMIDMPHSTGKTIDISLWDPVENKEVYMRDKEDGTDALFVDFYKNKTDEKSLYYQGLQEWVTNVMQDQGFRLGIKREYFHFDYKPDEPKSY